MERPFKRHAAAIALAVMLVQSHVFTRTASGVITGRVTDLQGQSFAGAEVQAKHLHNGTRINATSNADGQYSLQLPEGTYELSVHVAGMKTFHRDGLVVRQGHTLPLDVQLEEGPTLRTVGEDAESIKAIFENRPPPPTGPTPHLADGTPDLSGMWLNELPDFSTLELLPWAEELMDERAVSNSRDYPPSYCLPHGPVPLIEGGFFKLLHHPTTLVMMIETDTPGVRQVFLDGRGHPDGFGPAWLGHSVGKWDRDTLVIDSVGFQDRGWIDFGGYPHTNRLHVTQRLRRLDLGHLQIELTLDDPGAFRKPWTMTKVATLAPDEEIQEYICNENNKDVHHIVGN
jgi:carboxypeptidase family protein